MALNAFERAQSLNDNNFDELRYKNEGYEKCKINKYTLLN
jgi:hypothetical protein